MTRLPPQTPDRPTKRIAIAIEMDYCVPWHQDCCEGILRYGESQGWSCKIDPLLLGVVGQDAGDVYDGVVGRIDADAAEVVRENAIPAVNHWANSPDRALPSVLVDAPMGGRMAAEHLVGCGYRQLAYVGVRGDAMSVGAAEGLASAAKAGGLAPPTVRLFDTTHYIESVRDWHAHFLTEIDQWLAVETKPVGLLVGDSTMARYIAQQAMARGLSVPEDVGIVVWNDDMSTNAISPSLTVIEHDWLAIGYQSAALLDQLMQGKAANPMHRLSTPTRLIVRDSTDVFICDDPLVKDAMRYIADHARQELKVDEIAEALNTSRRTLYRKFDEVLGRSIRDEITRLRVARLKLMLQETDIPLVELSESFGFSSPGQFSRYFGKAVGQSPSAYRKAHGQRRSQSPAAVSL